MSQVVPSARRVGLLLLLFGMASMASAQWAWRDENGRTVYSDQPPPAGIKSSEILQQPQAAAQSQADSPDSAQPGQAAPPAPAPKPPPTTAEREQAFQKRLKDQAEAEKKQSDSEAQAEQRAADCERSRSYLKSLEDGVRLVRTTPDGEREVMDDEARNAELKRTRDFIETNCN